MNEQLKNITPDIFLYHGLIIFGELLVISVLVHMLYNRRSPASIIAWLLSMILLPYVSAVLYFIFGSRKRKNRYKKESMKLQNGKFVYNIFNTTKNRELILYTDSTKVYETFMQCIEESQNSIYISTYIFGYDEVTKKIIKALTKKAKDGVKVKILIDSLGSIILYLFQNRLKELRDAGVRIEFFMPIFEMPFRNYINLRNHRKIYIFDDKKVLSGGINLSNEYLGEKYSKKRWEDIMFLIEGSSVEHFFDVFASDWFYASKEKLDFTNNYKEEQGEIFLQVIPSGPDVDRDTLYEMLLSAIYLAKEKIYIITPYFIPNNALIQALIIAHHRGVDIKLVTPKESNHTIVNLVRSSYMRELEESGIEIYLYNGSMLHAKAMLFDEECVMLGSVNFDNRSLFLNYEIATFVYSKNTIKEIDLWVQTLLQNSSLGTKEVSAPKRIFENLMRVLAPQL
ncbi:MAG: hypothetical protein A2513_04045 [Sulfurimonas sp. RIFOXYD12_FULL_33_39]|uniref:phospholipase D-like domain-containing protein n=1 Tax=unclassified Sulfurimonas TaxID=2623549 RepID=UPI0008CFE7CE|nr:MULTISPECIES: phospholipase D-like domain-containing protein [unclassified Sulfurimonas]OHE09309.1 MAG: hypothetical protein A2513_04045 [Sulfurimonas sp. RIFOXYD12_FULL_33_39]OHE12908.1 MAG: hypothetical protein A2530_04760 [Sulfurimonas sp. RIFOXYD2_FULL_34_21]